MAKAKDVELIRKTPGVCGGEACIRGMRIPVWLVAEMRQGGRSDADILDGYPFLTQADLDAAWAYERAHPKEIARLIRQNQEA